MKLMPIIDGCRRQGERVSVEEAARQIAQAHRDGYTWDCRVATRGEGYRPLNEAEAEVLVKAVTAVLSSPA